VIKFIFLHKGTSNKANLVEVEKKIPRKVKKTRPVVSIDGTAGGYEEYYDWIFPDDNAGAANMKILEMAKMWKKKSTGAVSEEPVAAPVVASKEEIDLDDL
jgi:crooked neck